MRAQWLVFFSVLVLLGLSSSCTRSADVVPLGKATLDDLKKTKGDPERLETLKDRPAAQSATYPEGESYQIDGNRVTAHIRKPTKEESTLQYWRHAWKDHETTYSEVGGQQQDHAGRLFQFAAPELSALVVYDPAVDQVVFVVNYAK